MNAGKTKILIVDDHAIVAEGIKAVLQKRSNNEYEIVGTAKDGLEAVEKVKSLKSDIVLLDLSMPNMNGIQTVQEIKKNHEEIRIIVYSMLSDMDLIASLFRGGISGYILKGQPLSELVSALKTVREGGTFYSDSVWKNLQKYMAVLDSGERNKDVLEKLSVREKEIFLLLADGLAVKEIADRLCISPKTVETHKYHIMEKLDVDSVVQLTKLAVKNQLIEV